MNCESIFCISVKLKLSFDLQELDYLRKLQLKRAVGNQKDLLDYAANGY